MARVFSQAEERLTDFPYVHDLLDLRRSRPCSTGVGRRLVLVARELLRKSLRTKR